MKTARLTCAVILGFVVSATSLIAQADEKSAQRSEAEALVSKGIALSDGSQQEEELYLQAYSLDPTYTKPLFNLGLVYTDRRLYNLAITYFKQYEMLEVDSLGVLYQLGACYDNLDGTEKAVDYYTRYLDAAKGSNDPEETMYMEAAATALRRLDPSAGTSYREYIEHIVKVHNAATGKEIDAILSRPRVRGMYKYDGPRLMKNIQFEQDSAELLPEARAMLDQVGERLVAETLADNKIGIEGHTSTEGDEPYNMGLSEARANAVKEYLRERFNIPAERLDVSAYGESVPLIAEDTTEDTRRMNRRVEFDNKGSLELSPDSSDRKKVAPQ